VSLRWLVLPAGVALGLIAETGWPAGIDSRLIVADLAVGWLLIGGGFLVWRARPANRMGVLLIATGGAWFVATYLPSAAFIYCGPLVDVLVAHPGGRVGGRWSRIAVAAGYAVAALAVLVPISGIGLVVGTFIVVVASVRLLVSTRHRGASGVAFALAVIAGLVLAGAGAARLVGATIDDAILLAYEAALAATVLSVVGEIVWWTSSPGVLARFVLDLGGAAEAGTLRDRLARAVGDPSLTIGYAVADDANGWIDDAGRPVVRPQDSADRSVTPIAAGGRELGFVAHDPAFVGDTRVFGLIAAAAGLAISNSAAQAEIRRQVAKVEASRERLVHVADAQGRRLESALADGVDARLSRVAELLAMAAEERPEDAQLGTSLAEVTSARRRLQDFAKGVYPATLRSGGLHTAIQDLASHSPVPVETSRVGRDRYEPAVESTLYFVCSEALANVAKHAHASRVSIDLGEDVSGPVLRIADDGIGGANVAAGSGLRGLADRLEALGGSLVIDDRPSGGTAVTAAVPRARAVADLAEAVG
jgi:signal transduction histidine kinase